MRIHCCSRERLQKNLETSATLCVLGGYPFKTAKGAKDCKIPTLNPSLLRKALNKEGLHIILPFF
jgi:hypothetical protein